jgi:hypothetical protein
MDLNEFRQAFRVTCEENKMRSKWGRRQTTLVVTMLVFWVSPGCDEAPEMSGEGMMISADNELEGEGEDIAQGSQACAEVAVAWPEGWLVVRHEEWIPVLDDLGRRLHEARSSFQSGDLPATIDGIRTGVIFLEAQLSDASAQDRAALESSITVLRAIMSRLNEDEEVTLEQLDIALTNAYRSDLEREALVVETGSSVPYLERPERHLQLAIERFMVDNGEEEAAREIERASAYLRVEANRRDSGERAQLIEAAQDLEYVAARVRNFELRDRSQLDRVFEPVVQRWRQLAHGSAPPRSLGLTRRPTSEVVDDSPQEDVNQTIEPAIQPTQPPG